VQLFFFSDPNTVEFITTKEKEKHCKCQIFVRERKLFNIQQMINKHILFTKCHHM